MSVGLQQAWSGGRLDGLGALTASDARGLRATPRSPRGCIQKLAYKVDGFMVSNLVRLKPPNLKEPPALLEDLRDFTKSADFQRYVGEPAHLFPAPGRIKIRTHGQAGGSNEYKDITNVAFYGVFEPPQAVTEALMLGQYDDLDADLDSSWNVHCLEILHYVYQEISRCAVRKIDNGKGGAANVLIGCWRLHEVLEHLGTHLAFPGANMVHRTDLERLPKQSANAEPTKASRVADAILVALVNQPTEVTSITATAARPLVDAALDFEVKRKTWASARSRLKDSETLAAAGWTVGFRSFERVAA